MQQESPVMTSPYINLLSAEIFGGILAYLSPEDIIQTVWNVCKHWRDLTSSMFIKNGLEIKGPDISIEDVLRVLAALPSLQSLRLESRMDCARILRLVAHQCRQLRSLAIAWSGDYEGIGDLYCDLSPDLLRVIHSCSQLTSLALNDVELTNGLQLCRELGPALPNLRTLNLNDDASAWFGRAEMKSLLAGCCELEEFRADKFDITNDLMRSLARRWGRSLQILEIGACELSAKGLAALKDCPQLRELKLLCSEQVNSSVLQHLATLSCLDKLDMYYTTESEPEDWSYFFGHSESRGRLRDLGLFSCEFVDDGVLAAIAANCPALEALDISSCERVTGVGVGSVIRGCRLLRHLNVASCSLCCARAVLDNSQDASNLRILCLVTLRVEDSVMSDLKVALPHLKIYL